MRLVRACAVIAGVSAGMTTAHGQYLDPTRAPLWHIAGEGRGQPAADRLSAYFLSRRHEVLAVNAATGHVRWRATTGEPGANTLGSVVLVSGDIVVAGDYNVIAFDATTGALRWRFEPADGYAAGVHLGAAADGLVFAGSASGRAYAIDIDTGEQRWSRPIVENSETNVLAPVTDGRLVAVSYTTFTAPSTGGVVALDPASGRVLWHTPFPRPSPADTTKAASTPVLHGDLVLAAGGNGTIYGLDRRDGSPRWSIPPLQLPPPFGPVYADYRPLAVVGHTLVAGSLYGVVVAYDLRTLQEQWRFGGIFEGSVNVVLTADGEVVYVPFIAGRLVALNVSDGSVRWRIADHTPQFLWAATPDGGRVYAASSYGGFYAFRR